MTSAKTMIAGLALAGALALRGQTLQVASQVTSQVRGTVLEAGTGAPVAKAQIQLVAMPQGRSARIQGTTGGDGTFVLTGVPPGNYVLAARHAGHVGVTYETAPGQVTLAVRPNATNDVVIRMTPYGVVTGSVSRLDGSPVAHQRVMLSHFRTIDGKRALVPEREVWTDGKGVYKVTGVPPGGYLASAAVVQSAKAARRGHANVPSYFPDVTDILRAKLIEVGAGQTAKDINIRVRGPVPARSVSGVVVGETGAPIAGAAVSARRELSDGTVNLLTAELETTRTSAKGRFVFPALTYGTYTLSADGAADGRRTGSGTVGVGTRDVKGLKLVALASATVVGQVVMEGGQQAPSPKIARIALRPESTAGFPRVSMAVVSPDGTFTISGVPAGQARFDVSVLSETHYVKGVRMNGSDVSGQVVDVPGGGRVSGVVVTVSAGAAELSGSVSSGAATPGAKVVVFPSQSDLWDSTLHLVRTVNVDASGKFTVRGLRPGRYEAVALNGAGGTEFSPDLLTKLQASSRHLELVSGRTQREVVPAVDRASVER